MTRAAYSAPTMKKLLPALLFGLLLALTPAVDALAAPLPSRSGPSQADRNPPPPENAPADRNAATSASASNPQRTSGPAGLPGAPDAPIDGGAGVLAAAGAAYGLHRLRKYRRRKSGE